MGGENFPPVVLKTAIGGSSPRGRGKRSQLIRALQARGLIPAWAGKTPRKPPEPTPPPAHPRVGGENVIVACASRSWPGSSPRGRGKPGDGSENWFLRRLIPAWAGKTITGALGVIQGMAHPRVGGEN